MIQNSYTLIELSKNPIAPSGRVLASDVNALVGSKKRKRSELAVALDSESVTIYNIRSSKLITSYAVSPQAIFTCPPCSVRFRSRGIEPSRRLTYYSVTDPKPKLHCFLESCDVGSAKGRDFHGATFNIKDSTSPVVHLETLAVGNKEDVQPIIKILAVHEDGEIRCLSQHLRMEEWKSDVIQGSSLHVEHALVMSTEQATQLLLRNREDILAMLGPDEDALDACLLLLITRALSIPTSSGDNQLCLRIFHIRNSESARRPLQELISLTLPEPKHPKSEKSYYSWHGSSGTLLQNTSSDVAVYDLAGLIPRLLHYMPLRSKRMTSCLRLSASLIALTTPPAMSIIDIQYSSLQAEQTLESLSKNQNLDGKRKHISEEVRGTRLLSYFAPLDLVVVLQGRKLLAVQLSTGVEKSSNSRKRKRTGLLVDSIGRGISSFSEKLPELHPMGDHIPRPLGTQLPNSRIRDGWNTTRDRLDSLFKNKDIEQFERTMLSELSVAGEKEETNLTPDDLHRSFDPTKRSLPDFRKVHYLLNKIFILEQSQKAREQDTNDQKLKVSWFSDLLCRWLICHGLFSIDHIESSLKRNRSLSSTEHIGVGAYTQALVEWDKSLTTLLLILRSQVPLDAREIAHCLRYMMHVLNKSESPVPMKQLEDRQSKEEGGFDQSMQREDGSSYTESISPAPKLEVKIARNLLKAILSRLDILSGSKVAQALKTELSTQELRSLVDILRIELARGHWLSAYGEDGLEPLGDGHADNGQVCIIAKILNSVIDSIGFGGWILGASTTDNLADTEDTIAYMKAEISAALEGIEEATCLKGLLGQILLYGKSAKFSQGKSHDFPNERWVQIQSMPVDVAGIENSALPLGLKAAQGVTAKRVAVGGELIQRSRRDVGRLKYGMVGKYSFDRIII